MADLWEFWEIERKRRDEVKSGQDVGRNRFWQEPTVRRGAVFELTLLKRLVLSFCSMDSQTCLYRRVGHLCEMNILARSTRMTKMRTDTDNRTDAMKILGVVVLVCVCLWGCARNPSTSNNERLAALDARCQKLEQDVRSVTQMRDRARKDLSAVEEQLARTQMDLAQRNSECERLKQQLKAGQLEREQLNKLLVQRTGERDEAQQRWDRVRKSLQELISHEEVPVKSSSTPVLPVHNSDKPTNTQG